MPDFVYPHEVKDQIFPISLCLFVCLGFLSMFIIPFLKVISELRYFCFNAFYNVTVLHYNSILWEELLRNKKNSCVGGLCTLRLSLSPLVSLSLSGGLMKDMSTQTQQENIYIYNMIYHNRMHKENEAYL